MRLIELRNDAPPERFPVYISNAGRSHEDAQKVADTLNAWYPGLGVLYVPDADSQQGVFYLDITGRTALEIDGLNAIIGRHLLSYPRVYDLSNP